MAKVGKVIVVLRTCARVHALTPRPRMAGLQKPEVVLRCLRSLLRSIELMPGHQDRVSIHVVDDASDSDCVDSWKREVESRAIEAQWSHIDSRSGDSSFGTAAEVARQSGSEACLFLEDDYLHFPESVPCMLHAYGELRGRAHDGHIALTPYDCPDRYLRTPYPSTIHHSAGRYWRTVRHTTGTFLVSRVVLERFWDVYQRFGDYVRDPTVCEESTINTVYAHIPCFAAVPTLAIHLQYEETVPLLLPSGGWKALWDEMATQAMGEA